MRHADFRPGIIRGKAAVFPISLKCVHFKELFQPVCEVVQTSLCVVLGDDLGAGVYVAVLLAVQDLHDGLNCLVADVEVVLCSGHGQLAVQNGFYCGLLAVKAEEDGFCVVRIVLCGTGSCQRHIVVVGADDGNAFRILAHDALHRGYSEVSGCVSVLGFVIKELAASFVYAFAVAFHAGGVGCVTLNACDLDALDIGPAGCLCSFNSGLAALLGCFLVAGADECEALIGINAGIVCYDRLVGVCDSGCNSLGLQRSDQVAIVGLNRKVGLDGVELLLVVGLSRRTLDVQADLIRVLILICLSACLNNVLELGSVGLEHHADLVRAVMGGGGVAAVGCGRIGAAAASGQAECEGAGEQGC